MRLRLQGFRCQAQARDLWFMAGGLVFGGVGFRVVGVFVLAFGFSVLVGLI